MIRVILTAVATILVAAFVYGVVLNGFGLFSDWRPPDVADSAVPPTPGTVDPGVAGRGATRTTSGPAQTDASELSGSDGEAGVRIPRNVTPPNVLARPTSRYIDPETVEEAEEDEDEPDVRRYHQVIVRDAATLESGDSTIRLAGISPVPGEKTCTDETGQTWPCGRAAAAAALRMLIRHRAVDCTVVSEAEDAIVGTCSAGLQDINGWLVEQGWAEADPDAGYGEEADAARTKKRGIYLARWEIKGSGGSGLEPPPAFTAPELPPQPFQAPAFPSPDPDPPFDSAPSAQPEPSGQTTVESLAN